MARPSTRRMVYRLSTRHRHQGYAFSSPGAVTRHVHDEPRRLPICGRDSHFVVHLFSIDPLIAASAVRAIPCALRPLVLTPTRQYSCEYLSADTFPKCVWIHVRFFPSVVRLHSNMEERHQIAAVPLTLLYIPACANYVLSTYTSATEILGALPSRRGSDRS